MSLGRLILGAIVGGVIVFVWGYLVHAVLPIGEAGFKPLPNEGAMVQMLGDALKDHAAYRFPGLPSDHPTQADMDQWEAAYKAGPRGIIIFDPTGDIAMSPKMLGIEFASGAIAALIASIIASAMCGTYYGRVIMIALMGVFGWLAIDVSYWNWDRFPDAMTLVTLLEQGAGWLLAGFAIAAIVKCRCCGPGCGCGPECGCAA